jgi:hypothetical protein
MGEEKPTFLDAVFAFFGDYEPTDELATILRQKIVPTEAELREILTSAAKPEDQSYCQQVHDALKKFLADMDGYIGSLENNNPRKSKLAAIAAAHAPDPITFEMQKLVPTQTWKNMCTALETACQAKDTDKLRQAVTLRDAHLNGVYSAEGRIFGALMRECMKDLGNGLNFADPAEYDRRYSSWYPKPAKV